MKKIITLALVLMLAYTPTLRATTLSLQDSSSLADGQSASATNVVNNLSYLMTFLNNGIPTANIADGAITADKIAASTITADKLASGVGSRTIYFVNSTTTTGAKTNTSYADLDTMTTTQTFGNQDIEIDFECEIAFTSTQTVTFAILVDSVVKWEMDWGRQADFGTRTPLHISWVETVTSGSHTIKVQTKTNGSSYTIDNRSLKVK